MKTSHLKSPRYSIPEKSPSLLANRAKLFRACVNSRKVYNLPSKTDVTTSKLGDTLYVAFKGCSTLGDFINSIDVRKCKIHGEDVGIHNGFCEKYKMLYDSLWSAILTNLMTGDISNVVFTGHSAGGSIAQIMSMFLKDNLDMNEINTYCYTFGTPKTGDKSFKDAIENTLGNSFLRVETYNDLVCMLPMEPSFVHAGEVLILKDGSIFDVNTKTLDAKENEFFSYYYNDYVKLVADMSANGLWNKNDLNWLLCSHSCEIYTSNLSKFFISL